ncbi:hypothetical protein QAD02_002788 [Eretmocerus hayati]|uniref:Uncharacterized protein n=1 Tax=Eretmocerus hayati TaxID=131215 RepID=A0ACC2NJU9_9HYME|nr:hypothetical protein QAD02_002788 [Eretmocerus hayati]
MITGKISEDEKATFWDNLQDGSERHYHLFFQYCPVQCTKNILEALNLLLASYFIFNESYPLEGTCFLEMLQRRYLEICPVNATKSRRQRLSAKVTTMINNLKVFKEKGNKNCQVKSDLFNFAIRS